MFHQKIYFDQVKIMPYIYNIILYVILYNFKDQMTDSEH